MRLCRKECPGTVVIVLALLLVMRKYMHIELFHAAPALVAVRQQGGHVIVTGEHVETSPSLSPHKNIYFVKIHRTGSGSFHNVLVLFALRHTAFIALNIRVYADLFPMKPSEKMLLPPPTHPNFTGYNMWLDHARYYPAAGASFLPNDTLHVTQLREPFSHARSAYKKLKSGRRTHPLYNISYSQFKETPEKYEPHAIKKHVFFRYSISRNIMATELGYENPNSNNVSDFLVYLEFLNKKFSHVNILEDLPASLVLLKRKLHWELKDVLMLPIHVHSTNKTQTPQSEIEKHRQWSSLDYALYDFFLARHKREVAEQGPEFQEEVKALVEIQHNFTHFCNWSCAALRGVDLTDMDSVRELMTYHETMGETKFSKAFNVTYADCVLLRAYEITLKAKYKYEMYPGACEKGPKLKNLRCQPEHYVLPGFELKDITGLPRHCQGSGE